MKSTRIHNPDFFYLDPAFIYLEFWTRILLDLKKVSDPPLAPTLNIYSFTMPMILKVFHGFF
jgi:hypothetical protein